MEEDFCVKLVKMSIKTLFLAYYSSGIDAIISSKKKKMESFEEKTGAEFTNHLKGLNASEKTFSESEGFMDLLFCL